MRQGAAGFIGMGKMTKDGETEPERLDDLAAKLGRLARSGFDIQEAAMGFLLAEMTLAPRHPPGATGPDTSAKASRSTDDPGDDLFDNLPV